MTAPSFALPEAVEYTTEYDNLLGLYVHRISLTCYAQQLVSPEESEHQTLVDLRAVAGLHTLADHLNTTARTLREAARDRS